MDKVYIVMSGPYREETIDVVCSTPDKAKYFIEKTKIPLIRPYVEEWEVDGKAFGVEV